MTSVVEALTHRSGSSSLSSFFFFLLLSHVPSLRFFGVLFSERRLTYRFHEGTKGGAVWPSPSCLRGPKVMWHRRLERRRASFRLTCRFPPISQSMRFPPSRPT